MRWGRGQTCLALLAATCLSAPVACRDEPEDDSSPELSTESHPFTVGHVPEGYVGALAGEGTTGPSWGSDTDESHEPFTVLTEDGTPGGDGVVVVSFTGYEDRQGGLSQASRGYFRSDQVQKLEVDGHPAYFVESFSDEGFSMWSDLVVEQGDDLAVRITAPNATLEDLRAVLPSVVIPDSHDHAPEIVDPPNGLEVAGAADIDAAAALDSFVDPERRLVPGPPGSHSASWERKGSTREQLVVISLRGDSLALDVLRYATYTDRFVREQHDVDVGGRRGVVVETPWWQDGSLQSRGVLTVAPWGDVIVTFSRGEEPLAAEQLVAVAESVQRATQEEWEAFADELDGGAGFAADLSRTEVTRGEADGLQWLLQTADPGDLIPGEVASVVDGCLKLSDGSRRCAGTVHLSASGPDSVQQSNDPGRPFIIVTTDRPVGALQVVGFGREPVAQPSAFAPVPGTKASAAVVFLPEDKRVRCDFPYAQSEISVRVLAADGTDLGCADLNREGSFTGER